MFKRTISAFILFPLLIFLLLKSPVWFLKILVILTGVICFYEWTNLYNLSVFYFIKGTLILSLALFFSLFLKKTPLWLIFYMFLFFSFLPHLLNYEKEVFKNNFFPFVIGLFYLWIGLYPLGKVLEIKSSVYLIYFFSVVFGNDTGAYLSGKTFGKHKFFFKLSPKKTWEGFFGGLILAVIGGFIVNQIFNFFSFKENLFIALCLGIVAAIGDLFESAFKRAVGKKDAGALIPGHGGMLDRIDGVLFASPVFLLLLSFIGK
jgi:phosphatidate cytidylyltransferase